MNGRDPVRRTLGAFVLAMVVSGMPALGQTNERIYENLDFRFVTPGARAMGMGKTFVGLADDATAAYSNPAGLSNLLEKEFSFEFRGTDTRHERLVSLVPAGPTETKTFGETVWGPSFLSFVWPVRRWTFSFFLNTVQDYRENFSFQGRPVPGTGAAEDGAFGQISVRDQQYGVGISFVATRYLSVGGSVVVSALDLASEGRSGTPLNQRNGTNTIDSGTTVTGMGGVLLKPYRRLSLGASFYGGASFDLKTQLFGSFLDGQSLDGLHDVVKTGTVVPIRYVIPPRLGLGAAWQITDRFTLLGDADRIWYSRQISNAFLIVDFQAPAFGLSRDNFFIRDVWEVHGGAEFRIYRSSLTLALRAGVFTDPDHRIHFRSNEIDSVASELLDFRFNTVSDQTDIGATVGLGVMIKNRFQLDAAASTSPDSSDLVVSVVLRP
jgi:long-subunit fatty acid transport protein